MQLPHDHAIGGGGAAPEDRARRAMLTRRAAYASVSAASVLIVAKAGAWLATDSVAVLSSLLDSLLDGLASLVTLVAVRHAQEPKDSDHRYGHGKAEPLGALAQSGFVLASAVLLAIEALGSLLDPKPPSQPPVGIAVMVLSIVVTLMLLAYQRSVIRRTQSVAVQGDALHYTGDLLANLGVIAALVVGGMFGVAWVDPLFALLVAAILLHSAWTIGGTTLDMLMDREWPDEEREALVSLVMEQPGVLGLHDLRTRMAGPDRFAQMHLDLDGSLTLREAHAIADGVEKAVIKAFPGTDVIVHEDPVASPEARICEVDEAS